MFILLFHTSNQYNYPPFFFFYDHRRFRIQLSKIATYDEINIIITVVLFFYCIMESNNTSERYVLYFFKGISTLRER